VKTSYLTLRALLLTLVCSTAFAEPQALITVNPNLFAPGQNISKGTAGARLLALTGDYNTGVRYLPVYAQPVDASCGSGFPCALGGNLALGYTQTKVPSTDAILWGDIYRAQGCLVPRTLCNTAGTALRVNFDVPTNYITAALGVANDDGSGIYAFDSNGQLIAQCLAFPNLTLPPLEDPPGCASQIISFGGSAGIGWFQLTISRPTADVSFVLIGGFETDRPIAQVQFNSPVSLQLAALFTKVKGIPHETSLANEVMLAQTYYAVPDIPAACATLTGFMVDVKAQGRNIHKLVATQLLTTAQAIETGIQCT
jgi:hypothetical protein